MKLEVDNIQKFYSDEEIILNVSIPKRSRYYFEQEFQALKDKKLAIEIKEYRNTRTLSQNAYLWELLTQMALAVSGSKESRVVSEFYCAMLEEAQAEYSYITGIPAVEDSLRRSFRAIRKVGERDILNPKNEKVRVNVYQVFSGSSTFNTKQMNILIETVQHRLTELGIDYEPSTKSL